MIFVNMLFIKVSIPLHFTNTFSKLTTDSYLSKTIQSEHFALF